MGESATFSMNCQGRDRKQESVLEQTISVIIQYKQKEPGAQITPQIHCNYFSGNTCTASKDSQGVCSYIGLSPKVVDENYRQVNEIQDLEIEEEPLHNPRTYDAQSVPEDVDFMTFVHGEADDEVYDSNHHNTSRKRENYLRRQEQRRNSIKEALERKSGLENIEGLEEFEEEIIEDNESNTREVQDIMAEWDLLEEKGELDIVEIETDDGHIVYNAYGMSQKERDDYKKKIESKSGLDNNLNLELKDEETFYDAIKKFDQQPQYDDDTNPHPTRTYDGEDNYDGTVDESIDMDTWEIVDENELSQDYLIDKERERIRENKRKENLDDDEDDDSRYYSQPVHEDMVPRSTNTFNTEKDFDTIWFDPEEQETEQDSDDEEDLDGLLDKLR